ncbi:MAG: hypothetical protein Q9214_003307, partial [Letrouitia sp. 1 TL-2023]
MSSKGITAITAGPIRHIPGSKLTAATGWYETYYDVVQGGQFTFKIEQWHKYYGPIIRINPTEVHICDPDFYDAIYTSSTPFDKMKELKHRFGLPDGIHATVEHDLHHVRRIALNPYFSKRQIYFLAPYIQERATKLADRLVNEYRDSIRPVVMNDAWATYTADVVTYYCFSWSWDFLAYPDFLAPFTAMTGSLASLAHVSWHFPWLNSFFQSLPDTVLVIVNPTMKPVIALQQ